MKKFFNDMAIKFRRFMYGRYGIDRLYKGLLWIYLGIVFIAILLGRVIDSRVYTVLSLASFAIVIFAFYRVFSKQIEKRRAENMKWLAFENKIKKHFRLINSRWKFRKTHIFKTCPKCKAVLRLKRKKGTHNVTCPHCKTDFRVKVLF